MFTVVADTTDFLVDNLMDYFQGGLMDMAAWTNRKWHDAITMIENGTRQVGKRRHIHSQMQLAARSMTKKNNYNFSKIDINNR